MTATTLFYAPFAPVTVTASSTFSASYPGTNVLTTGVLKPWLANGVGGTENIVIDLGATKTLAAISIQAANMGTLQVLADNSNPPTTLRGTVSVPVDGQGRGKASLVLGGISARYVKLGTFTGATNDGGANWSIASVLIYANTMTLPADPLFGDSIDIATPQSRADLDNGVVIRDSTGPTFQLINLTFSGAATLIHERVALLARAGVCWLNFNNATAPWQQWPVRHNEPKISRKMQSFNRELVTMILKEEA